MYNYIKPSIEIKELIAKEEVAANAYEKIVTQEDAANGRISVFNITSMDSTSAI